MKTSEWIMFLAGRALRIAMLAYLGMLVLLAGCQRRFIYYPANVSMDSALPLAQAFGLEPWPNGAERFFAWRRSSADDGVRRRRVLVFHGNAGQALDRTYYLDGFAAAAPGAWDVILFEYPGYGPRSGAPSEKAIKSAAAAAFEALQSERSEPVYLVGESLGSGPACYLAGRYGGAVAGLWLVSPFTTLADAARVHYPVFPVGWLLRDRYNNTEALESYGGPLAVLTAGKDAVVPERLGRRLFESAVTPSKHWFRQPEADHNTLDLNPWAEIWSQVVEFWKQTETSPGG